LVVFLFLVLGVVLVGGGGGGREGGREGPARKGTEGRREEFLQGKERDKK
jgi:hypothetical protein